MRKTPWCLYEKQNKTKQNNTLPDIVLIFISRYRRIIKEVQIMAVSQKSHFIQKIEFNQFTSWAVSPIKSTSNERLSEGLNRNEAEIEGHCMMLDDHHSLFMQMINWVTTVSTCL